MNFFLFERSSFHLNSIVNSVAMREFKVCLSAGLSIYLGYKSSENLSILTNFEYVFAVGNFTLCTKNCDHILGTFYKAI